MSERTYGGITAAELRDLATYATPGPWILETDSCDCGGDYPCIHGTYPYEIYAPARQVDHYGLIRSARLANFPEAGNATMADAKFIAAANPAAVLELLDELRRQAARIAELEQAAESARAMLRILDRDGFGSIAVGATLLALDKALEVKL